MKSKVYILLLAALLILNLSGCNRSDDTEAETLDFEAIKESVWNQLEADIKDEIIGDWKDASIKKVKTDDIKDKGMYAFSREHNYKYVYLVTFESKNYQVLGDWVILADEDGDIVGYGLRE